MINAIWAFMLLLGIGYGVASGRASEITNALLEGAGSGVTLCMTMLGVMAMWSGIMEIGEKAGLIQKLSRRMEPLLRFLFPGIPKEHPSLKYIATNFVANILGLGWAATPAGLKAMESMAEINPEKKGVASKEMCTFLILNISSLQLIPMTMVAYRQQYGSVNPTAIIGPALVATGLSTLAGILFARIMGRK